MEQWPPLPEDFRRTCTTVDFQKPALAADLMLSGKKYAAN